MRREKSKSERGISIIELLVGLLISGLLFILIINAFTQSRAIHNNLERNATSRDDLAVINEKFGQALTSLPGREMGFYSGINYSKATKLPALGMMPAGAGSQPIQLGLVTPFRINGQDAIVILTTPSDSLRMELTQTSDVNPTGGTAYVCQPGLRAGKQLPITNLPVQDQLMFLIGSAPLGQIGAKPPLPTKLNPNIVADTRLIKLLKVPSIKNINGPGVMTQKVLQLDYTFPADGNGTQFPYLINNSTSNLKTFGVGAAVLPIKLVTFYYANGSVIRNENGSVVYDQLSNQFIVAGGTETMLGKADSLTITYRRSDQAAEESTPVSPLLAAPWLNQVIGVTVKLTRSLPPGFGHQNIKVVSTVSYPVTVETID